MATGDVIDWDEAMQQCGDDEEFLRELLADLRSETDTQVQKIEETIRVSFNSISSIWEVRTLDHVTDVSFVLPPFTSVFSFRIQLMPHSFKLCVPLMSLRERQVI